MSALMRIMWPLPGVENIPEASWCDHWCRTAFGPNAGSAPCSLQPPGTPFPAAHKPILFLPPQPSQFDVVDISWVC